MEHPVRILVVEDSASLQYIYRHMLSQAGYTVLSASTGQAAVTIIHEESPDILLLDRVLPDIDGSEICARVKGNPETADTYVIMVSGLKITEDDRVTGLEAGADDYVVKPVGKRELLARIRVAIRLRDAMLELRASEMKYRTLAENSPDYIVRVERDGGIRYLNPAAQRLFGENHGVPVTAVDFVRQSGDDEQILNAAHDVFATGRGGRMKSMLHDGETVRHLDTRLVPEFAPDGSVESILAVSRDYTDYVTAEQEIRRLATVIRQSVEAVQIADAQGRIIYTNAAYSTLTGLDGEAVLGCEMPGHPFVCQEDQPCRLLNHLQGGIDLWQGLLSIQHTDGEERELETTLFPIRDAEGQVTNYAALQRDVTERRRFDEERELTIRVVAALRKAVLRRHVLAVTLDQIMLLSNVVRVLYVAVKPGEAEFVVEWLHGPPAEFTDTRLTLAGTVTEAVIASQTPRILREVELVGLNKHGLWTPDVRNLAGVPITVQERIDGVLWIGTSASISERAFALFCSLGDMLGNSLERAELYEAIRNYAAELEQRVAERTQELAAANEQLRELDRLKSKFVSNVSHELRAPIATLKLYLSLLERGNATRRGHYEAMLHQSADRLGQLVEDILNLSRLEMAQLKPPEFSPTDLNAVVSQAVSHFQPQAEAAGLVLAFKAHPDLPLLDSDYNQLSQLVTNLISNALLYTLEGSISVQTCLEQSETPCIHLMVEDTGVGIEPEDRAHIFDRFYRGNNHPGQDVPGTGLGLAIVQEIVQIHHGRIDLVSEVGKGTKVDVILPCQDTET